MPQVTIRTATKKDIPDICRVLALSWKSAYRGMIDDAFLDQITGDRWTEFLETGLSTGDVQVLILEEVGGPAGVSILQASTRKEYPDDGELVCFYLLPEYIGQGYGHLLWTATQETLRAQGYSHCVLDALAANRRAVRFYRAHGFAPVRAHETTTLGGREYDCLVMRKCLRT